MHPPAIIYGVPRECPEVGSQQGGLAVIATVNDRGDTPAKTGAGQVASTGCGERNRQGLGGAVGNSRS